MESFVIKTQYLDVCIRFDLGTDCLFEGDFLRAWKLSSNLHFPLIFGIRGSSFSTACQIEWFKGILSPPNISYLENDTNHFDRTDASSFKFILKCLRSAWNIIERKMKRNCSIERENWFNDLLWNKEWEAFYLFWFFCSSILTIEE